MNIETVRRILVAIFYSFVFLIIFICMTIPIIWSSYEVTTIEVSGKLSVDPKMIKIVFVAQIFQLLICFFGALVLFYKKGVELGLLKSTITMFIFALFLVFAITLINYFFIDLIKFFALESPQFAG
ncbi:MAG: hypothetical protein AAB847_00050 [Patescibacteria group bacterium]